MRKPALLLALLLFFLPVLPACSAEALEPSENPADREEGADTSYLPILWGSFGGVIVLSCVILYIRRRKGYEPILQRRRRRR